MPAEERESFGNLLLLCTPHHSEVDDRLNGTSMYPADLLRRWKADREGDDAHTLAALGGIKNDRQLETLLIDSFKLPLNRLEAISARVEHASTVAEATVAALRQAIADLHGDRTGLHAPPNMAPPLDRMIDRGQLGVDLLEAVLQADGGDIAVTGLYGAGGFGKTRLAAWVCHQPEIQKRFSGGILWVTVGNETTDANVAEQINDLSYRLSGERPTLANPDSAGTELGQRLDAIERPVLLVIDDVWDEVRLRHFRFGGRRCTRLVTTRIPDLFPQSSTRVNVDAMTSEQAVELVEWGISELAAIATQRLVKLTGYWPVLLNLVNGALRVRISRGLPTEIAVAQVIDRLAANGPATFDPRRPAHRNQAVATTIRASLDLLDDADKARYLDLVIFAEDLEIPLDALALLWAGRDTEGLCEELTSLGLVADYRLDAAGPRVLLHDVIRSYLITQRTAAEHQAVHRRFVDEVAAVIRTNDANEIVWWSLPRELTFLWTQLVRHLIEADRADEASALALDLRWVEASIMACGSTLHVEDDLNRVGGPKAALLVEELRRISHLLIPTEPPAALGVTIASRLVGYETLSVLAESHLRTLRRPYLKSRWALPDMHDRGLTRSIEVPGSIITDCAFTPDEAAVISASTDGALRVWAVSTGALQLTIFGHSDCVNSCIVSPCGTKIASASDDGTARIWDRHTGMSIAVLRGHTRRVMDCAFSPDGSLIATVGTDKAVRIWDAVSGQSKRILTGHTNSVNSCTFSPDGRFLATASTDKTVRLWEVRTGQLHLMLAGHRQAVWDCAFSPNGALLASASTDRSARLWDVSTGLQITTLRGHTTAVTACAFLPNGEWLVTTSNDKTARLWRIDTRTEFKVFFGHTEWVSDCAVSSSGSILATASHDTSMRLWKLSQITLGPYPNEHSTPARGVAFSADGAVLASATSGTSGLSRRAHLWDVATGGVHRVLGAHTIPIQACAFAPDAATVATTGHGDVNLWSTVDGGLTSTFAIPGVVHSCTFSPDGKQLVATNDQGEVYVWNLDDHSTLRLSGTVDGSVNTCAFSPDGALLATGDSAGAIRFWNAPACRPRRRIADHQGEVFCCTFSPDGQRFASGGEDRSVRLWDPIAGTVIRQLHGHTAPVRGCDFSPSGSLLATVGEDRAVRIWNLETMTCIAALYLAESAYSCAWHPTEPLLAVAGRGGTYLLEYCTPRSQTPMYPRQKGYVSHPARQ
ncbi:NB-ARC domain-containing protein [Dactylosporangium sp. NPDC006015]|uniref:NB-ARC domain-containing protein n=1 Tax=Dactylosporangium sp. NPDC006015 TaxID=3154576 RepID=UPI0033A9D649